MKLKVVSINSNCPKRNNNYSTKKWPMNIVSNIFNHLSFLLVAFSLSILRITSIKLIFTRNIPFYISIFERAEILSTLENETE